MIGIQYLDGSFMQSLDLIGESEEDILLLEYRNRRWLPKTLSYHEELAGPFYLQWVLVIY